jgi:hypothetical protein
MALPTPKPLLRRLWDFVEQPLFLFAVGTMAAIVGIFVRPVLIVCAVSIVLAFHRAQVVKGGKWYVRAAAYATVLAVSLMVALWLAALVEAQATQLRDDLIAKILGQKKGPAAFVDCQLQLSQLALGTKIAVNDERRNNGSEVAFHVLPITRLFVIPTRELDGGGMYVVTTEEEDRAFAQFEEEMNGVRRSEGDTMPVGPGGFGTTFGPVLDAQLQKDIQSGHEALLFVGAYEWNDSTGHYRKQVCRWRQQNALWRHCEAHNGIITLASR